MDIPDINECRDYLSQVELMYPEEGHVNRLLQYNDQGEKRIPRELVRKHHVHKWLSKHKEFHNALKTLKRIDDNSYMAELVDLRIGCIAIFAFGNYKLDLKNRGRLKIISHVKKKEALKPIKKLISYMDEGLHFMDASKTNDLITLLYDLESEIENDAPLESETKKDYIANRMLTYRLARLFDGFYKISPTAIHSLMSIVTNIDKRQVARYLNDFRSYESAKKEYMQLFP